jgi:hypothetical protein
VELSPHTTRYSSFRSDRIGEAVRGMGGFASSIFATMKVVDAKTYCPLAQILYSGFRFEPLEHLHEINSLGAKTCTVKSTETLLVAYTPDRL